MPVTVPMRAEVEIPCPKCGSDVWGMYWGRDGGRPWVNHRILRHVCYLDPVDARLVVWILNNPDWE